MKKYELEIETNSYTGNFNRQLAAYVFGFSTFTGGDSEDKLVELFTTEVGEDFFHAYFDVFHDEHGPTIFEITSANEEKYVPNNLTFHFQKDITPHLELIAKRCREFPAVWAAVHKYADQKLKIQGMKPFVLETTRENLISQQL